MPMPRNTEPEKFCEHCKSPLTRKRYSGRLEDYGAFLRRKYCGAKCCGLATRKDEPSLGALRKRYLSFRGTSCQECGGTNLVSLHHIDGNPANNNPANLMTLCGSCHTRWHWSHGKQNTH
jgi:5-methylcytosine-specific restriction endonuclease McrA